MDQSIYKVCPDCGKKNLNRDYCEYCGAIINVYLKRKLEREQKEAEKKHQARKAGKNTITNFFENAKRHPNPFIRLFATFFYTIWVIVIAIGSFIAFLFGYVAA